MRGLDIIVHGNQSVILVRVFLGVCYQILCRRQQWLATASGFRHQKLRDTNLTLVKSGFAVAQVVMPCANEALVESQKSYRIDFLPEVTTPVCQGVGVVWAEVLDVKETEVGLSADTPRHRADTWEESSGENVSLNKVNRLTIALVPMIGDRDRLQAHHAMRLQKLATLGKVSRQKLFPNGFDHLNRDQLVVLSTQIAIVVFQQTDAIIDRGVTKSACGIGVLLVGDRCCGDPAAVLPHGMFRESSPARADFQNDPRA